ncbi:ankyrin repeat domain-containing protein [Marivita sp. S6314]|uniref:ankyrin repeat domain-containing protein n=1 Tax=Marivita sp. S6314 TaxID=2926406 RepID=UPI001FF5A8B3|nr:ankyrin repeat domain-containing protein [Marivita sp. S6314]MCK0149780.1 ankyrin repeat domain-containing protein [Marivita sp. S6314]
MSMDTIPNDLDALRREAKRLQKAYDTGDSAARERLRQLAPRRDGANPKRADFLHLLAREQGYASWPRLKAAAEAVGLDVAILRHRLGNALFHGAFGRADEILTMRPDVIDGSIGLNSALYRWDAVAEMLSGDPQLATAESGARRPIVHLAFSRWIKHHPDLTDDMLRVAELLLEHGADVNDGLAHGADHSLSVLYGAIGHGNNMALGQWLLDHGANPNDGESLYHATELGHHNGLRMLLAAGANPEGTNALLRAMDFHDLEAVTLLLAHGARADDFNPDEVGGEEPWTAPALHQAARRGSNEAMVQVLLDHGARADVVYKGANAYAYARVFGNSVVAHAIEERGPVPPLTDMEQVLAQIADGKTPKDVWIDPDKLPAAYRGMIRDILHLPSKLDHVKRLVAVGLEYDRPDSEGLTPVQVAGWEGLPEVLDYFVRLKPDLGHVNSYGGTLLSTILHGAENNPNREGRDYIACLDIALTEGVALPRQAINVIGRPEIARFLTDWAAAHPGQVV